MWPFRKPKEKLMSKKLFAEVTQIRVRYGNTDYDTLDLAKQAALEELVPTGAATEWARFILSHAGQIAAILSWQPNGEPAKSKPRPAVSDAQFEAAQKECGFPLAILKNRVNVLGYSLDKAKSVPYTPRPRKKVNVPLEIAKGLNT